MICFALLAHENEEVLSNQIENLKVFIPGCKIVLYNGGTNVDFGKKAGIPICPYSRPLQKGKLGRFFLDIMLWLKESAVEFDYLVNLDSDVMFIKPGFEAYLNELMNGYDCLGINMGVQDSPESVKHWYPGQTMWNEWERWQPFFQTNYFCGSLNSMQVYRHEIISSMLAGLDLEWLERLIADTEVFALEEMLYATLAVRSGGKHRAYPYESIEYVRLGMPLNMDEVLQAQAQPHVYFLHPIQRSMDDPVRKWFAEQAGGTSFLSRRARGSESR